MKVRLKKADTGGGYSPIGTPLAQVVQPPNTMKALPGMMPSSPNMIPAQPTNDPNNPGGQGINWDHLLASFVATNLAQGAVSRFSPNSQQNTTQQFNRQQFSPMNFLPYTSNNSLQAQYGTQGMQRGGMVGGMGAWPPLKEDGGIVDSEAMRKWILGDDTPATEEQEDSPQPQQQQEDTSQYDAQQFAMFAQMFGLDQADGEKEPEQQDQGYIQKKGGWIKHAVNPAHKGYCTPMTKSTCTGHRRAFAETMKKHHGFHEDGGEVGPGKPITSTTSHTIPSPHLPLRNNGQIVSPSYEFIPKGSSSADSAQYKQGFYNALHRLASGQLKPFGEAAFAWEGQFNDPNSRNPGLDVPGKSDMFNSGTREAYMNMPANSFQFKKDGGMLYRAGGEYDLSPEQVALMKTQGYEFE